MLSKDMDHVHFKLPRLFVDTDLALYSEIVLPETAAHYLKTVLRRKDGSELRVFNGKNGEWLAQLKEIGKRGMALTVMTPLRQQTVSKDERHLIFTPLKKDALDFLIEKSVELGVTHLHPVLTQKTVIRDIKKERLQKQIIEAAEQCERLDIPELTDLKSLTEFLKTWPQEQNIFAAVERAEAPHIRDAGLGNSFLIGPEGGFDDDEKVHLSKQNFIQPVSLGENILRAETAALFVLSYAQLSSAQ